MERHSTDIKKTYPDYTMKIVQRYVDGDYVISEFVMQGTHEVLFSIADEHQNKGYITEAASALLSWVFENGKAEFIVAIVKHDNTAYLITI